MAAFLSGCGNNGQTENGKTESKDLTTEPSASEYFRENMRQNLLEAVGKLDTSEELYFEDGLEITGLGVTYNDRPVTFDGCYYWPAIEQMTNAHISIDWHEADGYASTVAATLLMDVSELPDIVNPYAFGIMDLADDGLVVALDDYLEFMPDIVNAVGEERMDAWRQADGHIYSIHSVSSVQGSQSMLVRKDWLDELQMDMPETWEDWVALWRGIRDHDLNRNGYTEDEIPIEVYYGADGIKCITMLMNAFGIKASADCQFCILDDGTYTMVYEHPKYQEFLNTVAELYKEGIIRRDFDTYSYNKIEEMMKNNVLGTTMTWAAAASTSEYLRENGDEDALWMAVAPVRGPGGDQMIQERELVSSSWCITAGAKKAGKVENIVRLFNWCFTREGSWLYNYGIEGVSYDVVEEKPVIKKELIEQSFDDYRAVGCNFEPFGGLWLEDAFMQCLFSGKTEDELDEITEESYKGLFTVNDRYFYTQPVTFETNAYVKYRSSLITAGVCPLRDKTIRGEITVEDFFEEYMKLKEKGLNQVIEEAGDF